jgi:hypothetical protein
MTWLDSKAVEEWLISKEMSELHRKEILRCIEVTNYVDEVLSE